MAFWLRLVVVVLLQGAQFVQGVRVLSGVEPDVAADAKAPHAAVIIIGAGMAGVDDQFSCQRHLHTVVVSYESDSAHLWRGACVGITAGKTLSENAVQDLIILEARGEIGGRMMTHDFGGITIEKGANWIEGVNGPHVNPLIPIAKEIKLVNDYSNFENITHNIFGAQYEVSVLTHSLCIPNQCDLQAIICCMFRGCAVFPTNI